MNTEHASATPSYAGQGKLVIVGAGAVGAAIAYASLIHGTTRHVALYDLNGPKVRAEVLDLNHSLQFTPAATVEGSDDVDVVRDAAVVVITAGAKQQPGQTRLALAERNIMLCDQLIPQLVARAPNAILLLVTNPVDVLTYHALHRSGFPRQRVFGSGTVLDSSRLRVLIAQHCRVAVQSVHAFIVGEHGDSQVPLWSTASIGGAPLLDWSVPGHGTLTAHDREHIARSVMSAAYEIIQGKGATSYAIGLAVTQILESIFGDEGRVLPVTSLLEEYRGIDNICLSMPCIVDRSGVSEPLRIPLSDEEDAALRRSADAVRTTGRQVGLS